MPARLGGRLGLHQDQLLSQVTRWRQLTAEFTRTELNRTSKLTYTGTGTSRTPSTPGSLRVAIHYPQFGMLLLS